VLGRMRLALLITSGVVVFHEVVHHFHETHMKGGLEGRHGNSKRKGSMVVP
jgi:hypothetical protein